MCAAEFRQSVTIPAVPEQVRAARAFVAGVLGESHAHVDLALLLASELVTNSVWHSGSAVPGGIGTVTVAVGDEVVWVEVTDRCGTGIPVLPSSRPPTARRREDERVAAGGRAVGTAGLSGRGYPRVGLDGECVQKVKRQVVVRHLAGVDLAGGVGLLGQAGHDVGGFLQARVVGRCRFRRAPTGPGRAGRVAGHRAARTSRA